jgi:hypothetical protein
MISQEGTELLVGKTITSAKIVGCKYRSGCDGENVLELTFTDGSSVQITGGYGGYTGLSCNEYVELIMIEEMK